MQKLIGSFVIFMVVMTVLAMAQDHFNYHPHLGRAVTRFIKELPL